MLEKPARPHRDFAPKTPDKSDDSTQPWTRRHQAPNRDSATDGNRYLLQYPCFISVHPWLQKGRSIHPPRRT